MAKESGSALGDVVLIGAVGVGAWLAWPWLAALFGIGTTTTAVATTPATPAVPAAPASTVNVTPAVPIAVAPVVSTPIATAAPVNCNGLTVADAAQFAYSSSLPGSCITGLNPQLSTNLGQGQIQQINGNSVLAYMLGWGGATAGQTQTTGGDTYTFDGTNWNLQPASGVSGWRGLGQVRTMTGTNRRNYVRRGTPYRRSG